MKKFYIFRKNICLFIKGYKSRIQTLRFNYNKKQKEILPKRFEYRSASRTFIIANLSSTFTVN